MEHVEKDLADYLVEAINQDYLLCLIITSYTQAKRKTQNLPFGIGKTTLEFWLNYYMNGEDWNKVFESTVYNPYDLARLLEPGRSRLNAVSWDDVQATAPAMQGVPKAIRRLANFLSTERPEVACLIMTAPNINSISSPLRKLIVFEIIVVERGYYEVQKITYHKNFRRPLQDIAKLDYIEELARDAPFPPLPRGIEEQYKKWRIEQKLKLYPNLLSEIEAYVKLQQWTGSIEEIPLLEGTVIKAARGYVVKLPDEVGHKLHRRKVQIALSTC